jgi:regulator of protease activity HflC (stomatin/prohibitin superfamily)
MLFILSILVALAALVVWRAAAKKVEERNSAFKGVTGIAGTVAVLFVLVAFAQCFTVIPAGNVGVVDFFGPVSEKTLGPGINLVNPLAKIVKFPCQSQMHKEDMQVLSREGLTIGLEISVQYRMNPDSAARST